MTKFSIIIPVYKVEEYLEQCVRSVLAQSYHDYEIILVDDGSPDKCPQMCDDFSAHDDRVRVIHKNNGGLSSARNAGLIEAKGEYILFIDSDDYICDSDFLANLSARINQYNEDVILFGCKIEYPNQTFCVSRNNYDFKIINSHNKKKTLNRLFEQNNFPGSAWIMCVKHQLIKEKGFRFRLGVTAEDFEWIIKIILSSNTLGAIDGIQYVYRKRENSITSRPKISGLYGTLHAIDYYLDSNTRYNGLSKFVARLYLIALMGVNGLEGNDKVEALSLLKKYIGVLLVSKQRIIYILIKILGLPRSADAIKFLYRLVK